MNLKGFTIIDNSIIHDKSLKSNEKEIFNIIRSMETIPNFRVSKGLISKEIQRSYRTTQNILSSLREKGLVILRKVREGKKWIYYYVTKFFEEAQEEAPKKETKKEVAPKKEVKEEVVAKDSDNNEPIQGQIHISEFVEGEVLEVEKEATKEGLNADLEVIRKAIEVADNYDKKITNRTKFILGTIRNLLTNKKTSKSNPNFKKQKSLSCHNFSQREYDWDSLENELLGYGLNDSVNELDSVPQLPSFIGSDL